MKGTRDEAHCQSYFVIRRTHFLVRDVGCILKCTPVVTLFESGAEKENTPKTLSDEWRVIKKKYIRDSLERQHSYVMQQPNLEAETDLTNSNAVT